MIGSEALAREIATFPFWGRDVEEYDTWHRDGTWVRIDLNLDVLPEGWSVAGRGSSRIAFLGPDGVIYKKGVYTFWGEDNGGYLSDNFMEAYVYHEFADMVSHETNGEIRLAECTYFYDLDIVAMEHSVKTAVAPPKHIDRLRALRMGGDIHGGNIWSDKRGTVMVDYGYVDATSDDWGW
jgi:hypothetical protein